MGTISPFEDQFFTGLFAQPAKRFRQFRKTARDVIQSSRVNTDAYRAVRRPTDVRLSPNTVKFIFDSKTRGHPAAATSSRSAAGVASMNFNG